MRHEQCRPMPTSREYPCKDCADRNPGCHGDCQRYLSARRQAMDEAAQEKARQRSEVEYMGYHYGRCKTIGTRRPR